MIFANQALREQQIGEIDLPDLLENFTAFQFIPATNGPFARLSSAYLRKTAGDRIVEMLANG
jgi:hypothetical protein